MSDDERAARLEQSRENHRPGCGCSTPWPCDAAYLMAERDALAARLAAAEQVIADVQFDLRNCHQQNACEHIQDALMIVNRHGAALAGGPVEQGEGER